MTTTADKVPPSYEDWCRDNPYMATDGDFRRSLAYEEQWGVKRRQYLEAKYADTNEARLDLAIKAAQQGITMAQNLVRQRDALARTIGIILRCHETTVGSIQLALQAAVDEADGIAREVR